MNELVRVYRQALGLGDELSMLAILLQFGVEESRKRQMYLHNSAKRVLVQNNVEPLVKVLRRCVKYDVAKSSQRMEYRLDVCGDGFRDSLLVSEELEDIVEEGVPKGEVDPLWCREIMIEVANVDIRVGGVE